MKILMASLDFPPNPRGGEGLMAIQVARGLCERGFDVEVIAPLKPGSEKFDADEPFAVHRVKTFGSTFLTTVPSFYWAARKFIREFNGDLIYSLRPVPTRKDLPHVHHFHTLRRGEAYGCWKTGAYLSAGLNLLYAPLDSHMVKAANAVVVLTSQMAKVIKNTVDVDNKCTVIGNGIDPANFPPNISRLFDTMKLLYVGRLDARKGLPDLLNAFRLLSNRHPALQLTIVGDGPIANKINRDILRLNLGDRVTCTTPVDQKKLVEFYHQHDLLVVPSIYEAFGLVVLEGMSTGIPVLSSDQCAAIGQIMYPAGDVRALTARIEQLVSSDEKRRLLSTAGYEAAVEWTSEKMADSVATLFHTVTSDFRASRQTQ
ncbi:MAG: glycosyltransferase family 4 protein [Halioglobus sp.]